MLMMVMSRGKARQGWGSNRLILGRGWFNALVVSRRYIFRWNYISVKYKTHFKCPPNNIHQGESEGKNLYQCKECGNSMCLVCSVVDVTISHFYGQVARYEIGTMFFWYTCSHVREGIQQTPGRAPCMVRCLSLLLELEFLIDQNSWARWQWHSKAMFR